MTAQTTTQHRPPPGGPPRAAAPSGGPGRRAEWLGGWRVALRLARRDARRHRGRSALIVLMVALPVLLLVAGNIIFSTNQLSGAERLPYLMGTGQAHVRYTGDRQVPPLPDPAAMPWLAYGDGTSAPATAIPGWGEPLAQRTAAIGALLNATAYPVLQADVTVTLGRRVVDVTVLAVDAAAHPSAGAFVRLQSGRLPRGPDEALVTPAGIAKGLPNQGPVSGTERMSGLTVTVTVVGVAEAYAGSSALQSVQPAHLVMPPAAELPLAAIEPYTGYVIERDAPVSWAEVKRLAAYGLSVTSRAVILDPPPASEVNLPMGFAAEAEQAGLAQALTAALLAMGLLLETTLLVGPAFAVSAARQRRTLALAASNGATTAQLRRSVLAQALVLGVLAAAVGALLGVVGAWGVVVWSARNAPDTFFGPFDLPLVPLAIILGCAVLAALVAALIPARGLGRLDIVAVMRGQSVSPTALRRTPVAGLICAGLGTLAVFWAIAQTVTSDSWLSRLLPFVAMAGFGLLVIGALLLVPMTLVAAARLTRAAPVAWRMATRDAARQRGRATSTVAAILGATALLSTILVVAASESAARARVYQPRLPAGQGMIMPRFFPVDDPARWLATAGAVVREADPALQLRPTRIVDLSSRVPMGGRPPETQPFFVALRRGCTPERALGLGEREQPDRPPDFSCLSLAGGGGGGYRSSSIAVGDIEGLLAAYPLEPRHEKVLRDGGVVVNGDPAPAVAVSQEPGMGGWSIRGSPTGQVDIVDGKVTFASGQLRYAADRTTLDGVSTVSLPAEPIARKVLDPGAHLSGPEGSVGALMTEQTAARLGLQTVVVEARVIDPRGAISEDAAGRLGYAVADLGLGNFYVERGFEAYDAIVAAIVLGIVGLIILVATLVSTALSTAETQPLMGTFAAVGATRRTRRNLAAAQAASLGILGALLGVLVGFVPGIAFARTLSAAASIGLEESLRPVGPIVVIPWLPLLIAVLGVPLLAGALAWLSIRRRPTVTRRLT